MVRISLPSQIVAFCFATACAAQEISLMPHIDYLRAPLLSPFELHQQNLTVVNPYRELEPEDFIPVDIPNRSSGRNVASRIAQHSAQSLLESKAFRRSQLGRSAESIDSKVRTDISPSSGGAPLEFRVKATQTMASIRYAGFGQTVVSYRLYDQAVLVEISGILSKRVRIVADHLDSPDEKAGKISLRWTW